MNCHDFPFIYFFTKQYFDTYIFGSPNFDGLILRRSVNQIGSTPFHTSDGHRVRAQCEQCLAQLYVPNFDRPIFRCTSQSSTFWIAVSHCKLSVTSNNQISTFVYSAYKPVKRFPCQCVDPLRMSRHCAADLFASFSIPHTNSSTFTT